MKQVHILHPSGFVAAAADNFSPRFDDSRGKFHDVFVVVGEGPDGEHIARTVFAASEDDARQAYQENYADEPIVAVHH